MEKKMGCFFIGFGLLCMIYSIFLFELDLIHSFYGAIWNILFLVFDSAWYFVMGSLLLITGVLVLKKSQRRKELIQASSYLSIFSLVFFPTSLVFNKLTDPILDSTGRVFTFFVQTLQRLLHPSLSFEYFVPFCGMLIFIIISVYFKKNVLEKLK